MHQGRAGKYATCVTTSKIRARNNIVIGTLCLLEIAKHLIQRPHHQQASHHALWWHLNEGHIKKPKFKWFGHVFHSAMHSKKSARKEKNRKIKEALEKKQNKTSDLSGLRFCDAIRQSKNKVKWRERCTSSHHDYRILRCRLCRCRCNNNNKLYSTVV